jgi:hypothetical protein
VTCNDEFCYYLGRAKKTWTEALQGCRNFNADLVSIHSEDEWQFIVDKIIAPQSIESVHLGQYIRCTTIIGPIFTRKKFPRTENFLKISLLKVENLQFQNLCRPITFYKIVFLRNIFLSGNGPLDLV